VLAYQTAWSGLFPRVSENNAKRIASLASDPAISAQLGWAEEYYVSPGGPTAVSWLVTDAVVHRSS
jgi:hypothetical protein